MKQNKALISCTGIEFVALICYFRIRIHKMQVFSLFLKKGVTLYLFQLKIFEIFVLIFAKNIGRGNALKPPH